MTVATNSGGNSVIPGMEDLTVSDIRIPRIKILHKEGKFKDPLTGAEFGTMKAVILGVVKQRVMWNSVVEDGDVPRCKSTDHATGYPNMDDDLPKRLRFPWAEQSAFSLETAARDEAGRPVLPCARCEFTKWNNKTPPACAEQYVMPVIYSTLEEPDISVTAILSVQKTGVKPITNYMSGFVQRNEPMFSKFTTITLNLQSNGSVDYSVPRFQVGDPTDFEKYEDYVNTYTSIREFLRRAPRSDGDEEIVTVSDNTNRPAPGAPAAQAPAPAAAPAPAPAPQQAAPAPAPAPVAPEPAPAAAPAAPQAAAPAPAPAPAASDDDDLPF